MAVKQNNTESNTNASAITNNAQSGTANTDTANIAQNVNSSGVGGGGGGGVKTKSGANFGGIGENNKATHGDQCSGGFSTKSKKGINAHQDSEDGFADDATKNFLKEFEDILKIIQLVEREEEQQVIRIDDLLPIYKHLLQQLSHVRFRRDMLPAERQHAKEGLTKIAEFFAKPTEKHIYFYYLRIIWPLITESVEPPSPVLATIFGLFDTNLIFEAVQMLFEHQISDDSIRQTVRLFCTWLCSPTVNRDNMHEWICAIIKALETQQKFMLLEEIALDNIEIAFKQLMVPILRPKVFHICYMFLSKVLNSPAVFHKIVPRIPTVFKNLKKQPDVKVTLQAMSQVISRLLLMFPGYDEFYQPVVECLKECQFDDTFKGEVEGDSLHLAQFQSNAKAGLVNLGNTCYMNSVLQALANTKEFTRDILLCQSSSPLILRMQEQIALMLYSYRNELSPSRILQVARPLAFAPGLQQDSSEFLSHLLETIHEQETVYLKSKSLCAKVKQTPTKDRDLDSDGATALCSAVDANCASSATDDDHGDEKLNLSTIENTFSGKQVTIVRCLTCGCKSRNIDSFRDLQLSFPEHKSDYVANYSVQDLLDFYYSPEKLDGANKYFCDSCKNRTDAERSVRVIKPPKNLIITLKHFKYDVEFHKRAKLMHKVFHDEKVYVKVCASDSLEEIAAAHYDLYASVVHSGYSMDSGHYYTYASDASNRWFKFNDNIVTPSKAEELHNLSQPNTPYILFYQMSARSNEQPESAAFEAAGTAMASSNVANQIVKVEMPSPLKLEELPNHLQEYVNRDNCKYNEELRVRRLKSAAAATTTTRNFNRRNDEDGDPPTPGGGSGFAGCGGNALGFNSNRFIC